MYRGERQVVVERSETMENAVFEIEYREYMRQMAWVNEHDWQFERPAKQHPVRRAVVKALIALADALTPAARRETQAA
jgi:hypothetical protein